jgi:glutathione peroxidase
MNRIGDFSANGIDGAPVDMARYAGKVLLIVNTASKCVYTAQYEELEALYRQFRDQGLEVLGFPCNQFRAQEPGTENEIAAFCQRNYGVSFPMFAKIDVNGERTHPLFEFLKSQAPGVLGTKAIKWNFTKFLVNRDGTVYKRYAPRTPPRKLAGDIRNMLAR